MKYTLLAKSLLEIETQPEGILITETCYPDDPSEVFISNDRIEELLKIFESVLATLKEGNNY
jgi:hypothetical protein